MSADLLREAAAKMRERAEGALAGPWEVVGESVVTDNNMETVAVIEVLPYRPDAEHIASWHPAVALAVADWLEQVAVGWSLYEGRMRDTALAVARAYLGRDA